MAEGRIQPRPLERLARGPTAVDRASLPRAGLQAGLRNAAVSVAAGTALFEVALFYRLWAQLTASVPNSAPWSWLYGLTGLLVDPFYRFDTVTPIRQTSIFEFPALIAMEAYLLIGMVLAALLALLGGLVGGVRLPEWRTDPGAFNNAIEEATRRLRGGLAGADQAVEETWGGLVARLGPEARALRSRMTEWYGQFDWRPALWRLRAGLETELDVACSEAAEIGTWSEGLVDDRARRARTAFGRFSRRAAAHHERLSLALRSLCRRVTDAFISAMKEVDSMLAGLQGLSEGGRMPGGPRMALLRQGPARQISRREFIQRVRPRPHA